MKLGKAAGPQWWSRPEPGPAPGSGTVGVTPEPSGGNDPHGSGGTAPEAAPHGTAPEIGQAEPVESNPYATPAHGTAVPPVPPAPVPLHAPDPYGTPPYGEPGPFAPAPPVSYPLPEPAPPLSIGAWHRYDPWAASGPVPVRLPRRRRGGVLVAGAALVALVAGMIGGVAGAHAQRDDGIQEVSLPQAAAESGARAPDSVAGIAARTLPGVVYIHVEGEDGEGTGTGFVLDKKGHILTNNHVVESGAESGEISVTFDDGQVTEAEIVGRDTGYDLAVIKVAEASGLHPLTLGDSESVRVGDPVVAIGAPYGLEGTVTSGIISATRRPITAGGEADGTDVSYVDALQTDAPINPGNSGGPLVDAEGRVIGINSAIRAADSGSDPFGDSQGGSIGLGFAIPVNPAKRVAEELISTGTATHPVIGVTLDMSYEGDGARVGAEGVGGTDAVTPGGPGDEAGIEAGDLITEVDGQRVRSGEELIVKVRSHRPGDRLRLTVERDGKERAVELTLGSASGY